MLRTLNGVAKSFFRALGHLLLGLAGMWIGGMVFCLMPAYVAFGVGLILLYPLMILFYLFGVGVYTVLLKALQIPVFRKYHDEYHDEWTQARHAMVLRAFRELRGLFPFIKKPQHLYEELMEWYEEEARAKGYTEDDALEEVEENEEIVEELPFCQLFEVGEDMCLLVDHIEMCPDETAFIRVVDDEGYTPLYKRKVRRDKAGTRHIIFNSTKYELDDDKTQPIIKKP